MGLPLRPASSLLSFVWRQGAPVVFQSGGWPAPFGISVVGDLLSATMAVMSQAVLLTGVVYALGSRDQAVRYRAFLPLFLALATGLTGAMLSGDLFNLFVFAELLVLSSTALTAISDDPLRYRGSLQVFLHQPTGLCFPPAGRW
jgi:multicomponent Na+:H+ antiporter subunit D